MDPFLATPPPPISTQLRLSDPPTRPATMSNPQMKSPLEIPELVSRLDGDRPRRRLRRWMSSHLSRPSLCSRRVSDAVDERVRADGRRSGFTCCFCPSEPAVVSPCAPVSVAPLPMVVFEVVSLSFDLPPCPSLVQDALGVSSHLGLPVDVYPV